MKGCLGLKLPLNMRTVGVYAVKLGLGHVELYTLAPYRGSIPSQVIPPSYVLVANCWCIPPPPPSVSIRPILQTPWWTRGAGWVCLPVGRSGSALGRVGHSTVVSIG